MKRFVVRKGAYSGTHFIYDNPEEARKILGNDLVIKDWETVTPDDCDNGTWMHLTDGTVAQLLYKRKFVPNEKQRKIFGNMAARYAMRFPFYTVPMWYRKSTQDWARGRVFGQPSLDSTKMLKDDSKRRIMRDVVKNDDKLAMKLAFAQLILGGASPQEAARVVCRLYNKGRFTDESTFNRIRKRLMTDEIVVTTIQNAVAPFKTLLEKNFTDERMVAELEKLLSASRAGTMNHRENLKFIMELTGHYGGALAKKESKKNVEAQTVPYEDVPPPRLGKS